MIRNVASALVTLILVAALDALGRGEGPARAAGLALVVLGVPTAVAALLAGRLDRRAAPLTAAAAAIVLFVFGLHAMDLHARWVIFAPRPRSLAILAGLGAAGLAVVVALRFGFLAVGSRLPEGIARVSRVVTAVVAAALFAVGLVPRSDAARELLPASGDRPNVVLVTIDTLRKDHLSAYGYEVHRTPALDRIAAEGLRFDAAWSPAPWTLPALGSIMTGYNPSVLGIHRTSAPVPPGLPTLAARLAAAGYDTHAVVGNIFAGRKFGLHAGFRSYDHLWDLGLYDDLARHPLYRFAQKVKLKAGRGERADRVTDHALAWLRDRPADRPFFLWLHYMDPHDPYGGEHIREDLPCGAAEAPRIGVFIDTHMRIRKKGMDPTPVEREHLVHLYDAEIRYLDRDLDRLFAALDAGGLPERTLLVVTSDHGEEFWEHGDWGHGHSVYREVSEVPLLVRWPGVVPAGRVIESPVSLLGLAPTVLRAAGLEAPAELQGRPIPLDGSEPGALTPLTENLLVGGEQKALRDASYTLILREDGRLDAYDRRDDPGEHEPLGAEAAGGLAGRLHTVVAANDELHLEIAVQAATSVELTSFEREQLRALGYVD